MASIPPFPADASRIGHALLAEYAALTATLTADAAEVRAAIVRNSALAGPVYARFVRALHAWRELELYRLAFPGLLNGALIPTPPEPPNIAVALFQHEAEAVGAMRLRRFRPVVSRTAGMTKAQAHAAELDAVRRYAARHARELSPEMRALLVEAGLLAPAEAP